MSGENKEKKGADGLGPTALSLGQEGFTQEVDADEALQVVVGNDAGAVYLDAEAGRRLLRKIDWNLMPVWLRYLRVFLIYVSGLLVEWVITDAGECPASS